MAFQQIGLEAVLRDENFQKGMSRYMQGLDKMTANTDRSSNAITAAFARVGNVAQGALTIGIGAATAAFGALVGASSKGLAELNLWGEQIDKLGDQFGYTGEQASAFAFLSNKVGLSVEEMGMGLNGFTRQLDDMQKSLKDPKAKPTEFALALQKLGVKATDAKGKIKSFDKILPELMDAFKKLPPGVNSSALAMQLFGARGGSKFLDFLRQGSKGLDDARKSAKLFGLEISSETSDDIENFGFAMNELKLAMNGAWLQIGKAALPIARQLVDTLIANLPRVIELTKQFGTWMTNAWGKLMEFVTAFQRGGVSGVFDKLGQELGNVFKGFDLTKSLQSISTQLQTVWSKTIAPELTKWGARFWDWLTNDVLPNVSVQMAKLGTAITDWIRTNAPDWMKTFELWKTSFWNWLTDKNSGVVSEVGKKLETVTTALREWSASDEAQTKFIEVGKTIAQTIIDGIAQLFTQDPTANGENVFVALGRSLGRAADNILETFRNIGRGVAQGVIEGIFLKFGYDAEGARRAAQSIVDWMNRVANLLIEWGTPASLAQKLFNNFISSWNNLFRSWQPGTPTPSGAGTGSLGGTGGVGVGIGAAIGAGTVSTPQVSRATTNSRSVTVNNTIGGDVSGLSPARVEQIAQIISERTVAAVMGVA